MADKLTDDQISELKEVFDLFDKDKSGAISLEELERLFKAIGANPKEDEIEAILKEIDKDRSGVIEFEEFKNLIATKTKKLTKEEELIEAFKLFDKDGSGTISSKELREVITTLGERLSEEETDNLIKEADQNGDGKINYEEFVKMVVVE